jgi:hypothetical protein
MSATFRQVIAKIGELSSDEKALVAHCLISSLEEKTEDGVDEAWAELAEKRYLELESGAVKGATWQEVKNVVKG